MPDKSRLEALLMELSTGADAVLDALGQNEAASLVDEFARLAGVGLKAYAEASGVAITPDSILKLLPDQMALKPPAGN